ncbi:MAG TPA: Rrf2 family transcriptional regulator [Caulobacteraceae bacterium]|jgi:Rrf2 family protein|nr:Rrf2 family transcriptional regulator [Caulobacteraceae bacterium]
MLSQRGRYALKALLNLARNDPDSRQVAAISLEENIPRKFLEAIMTDMRRARLVISMRGKTGGFRLARPADLISFAEVMRVTDGPLALIACASPNFYRRCDDCPDEAACVLRRVLGAVRNEVAEILDRTTLADALAKGMAFDLEPTAEAAV